MKANNQIKNMLNMGWYDNKAVYYNINEEKFYISNIKKNSSGIMLLAPIVTTILGKIFTKIDLLFKINFIEHLILIAVFIMISSVSASYTIFLMKKKAHFKPIEFYPDQLKNFLNEAQIQKVLK